MGSRVLLIVPILWMSGCGDGVQVIRESENAGVVRYRYQEHQGYFLSPNRSEALEQAAKFCRRPIQIVREGPTQGRKRMVEGMGGPDVIDETWWGIRFRCQ